MHFTIRRTGCVLQIDLRGAPDHFMGRLKSTIKVPPQRALRTVSTMQALSSLGAFYDFDERNKKPFKGTERVINQRTALQTAACYTDGLESFITFLMTWVCLPCFTSGGVSRVICVHSFPIAVQLQSSVRT